MNKLNSKNWQRVRISNKTKTITFTNDETYKTKAECEKDIKSAQYIAINQNALNKLLNDGYTVNDTTINLQLENAVEVKETTTNVVDLTGDVEVEEAIRQNYIKSKEKKGIQFVNGASIKEISNVEAEYFAKLTQSQPIRKESEFQKTYDNKWNKYYEKRGKEITKEKETCEVTI